MIHTKRKDDTSAVDGLAKSGMAFARDTVRKEAESRCSLRLATRGRAAASAARDAC